MVWFPYLSSVFTCHNGNYLIIPHGYCIVMGFVKFTMTAISFSSWFSEMAHLVSLRILFTLQFINKIRQYLI